MCISGIMEGCESISAWGSGGEAFLHREDGGGGDDDHDHDEFDHMIMII